METDSSTMHIPTHILSGWCITSRPDHSVRERLFAVLAATIPDLDGLSLFWGREAYLQYHHTFGHSLFFGLSVASVLGIAAGSRLSGCIKPVFNQPLKAFGFFLALFHLHLFLDFLGSGEGWGLAYGWPFTERMIENPWAWPFASWQNYTTGLSFGAWALWRTVAGEKNKLVQESP